MSLTWTEKVLGVDVVDVVLKADATDDGDLDVATVTVTPNVVVLIGVMDDEPVVLTQT